MAIELTITDSTTTHTYDVLMNPLVNSPIYTETDVITVDGNTRYGLVPFISCDIIIAKLRSLQHVLYMFSRKIRKPGCMPTLTASP